MLGKMWLFLKKQIVTDAPDELSACLDCGVSECREGRFQTCPNRLARAAALKALRTHPSQEPTIKP